VSLDDEGRDVLPREPFEHRLPAEALLVPVAGDLVVVMPLHEQLDITVLHGTQDGPLTVHLHRVVEAAAVESAAHTHIFASVATRESRTTTTTYDLRRELMSIALH